MVRFALVLCVLFALFTPLRAQGPQPSAPKAPVVSVPIFPNATCPIMGKPVSTKLYVDTPKGRIYVCCKSCNAKILADVDTAYKSAYPAVEKAANTKCPIKGDAIDKDSPRVAIQGREIALCCDSCLPALRENAQIVLAKLANPKLVDLDNSKCPVTGEPVTANTFCVIDDTLVRLASMNSLEAVQKEPAKYLAKAKEIAASDEAARKAKKAAEKPANGSDAKKG